MAKGCNDQHPVELCSVLSFLTPSSRILSQLHKGQILSWSRTSRIVILLVIPPSREYVMFFAVAEWIEDSALAGAPLATYATNHETYRDPQTGPPVPNAMGQKRKFSSIEIIMCAHYLLPFSYPEQPIMS